MAGRAVIVTPTHQDMGPVKIGCDQNAEFIVVNRGSTPLRVVGVEDT